MDFNIIEELLLKLKQAHQHCDVDLIEDILADDVEFHSWQCFESLIGKQRCLEHLQCTFNDLQGRNKHFDGIMMYEQGVGTPYLMFGPKNED
ncbi:MAG: hypothetical protein EOM50_24040 [Erysipelotrichia bacterium]|nr:hypothetical protein [Erysipelotrichia bacterium]